MQKRYKREYDDFFRIFEENGILGYRESRMCGVLQCS